MKENLIYSKDNNFTEYEKLHYYIHIKTVQCFTQTTLYLSPNSIKMVTNTLRLLFVLSSCHFVF